MTFSEKLFGTKRMKDTYKLDLTAASYRLEIPKDDFLLILDDDSLRGQGYIAAFLEDKMTMLFNIEFDGHFGNAICYSVRFEDDKQFLHDKIKNGIKEIVDNLRLKATSTL